MRNILEIASALNTIYHQVYSPLRDEDDMTEMKMHKMLYFAQKTHYKNFGKWLFEEDFEGWVHGPVNKEVRSNFTTIKLTPFDIDELTPEEEYTIRETVFEYGQYDAFTLREMSHDDKAYLNSREGLGPNERGNRIIKKEDIILDIENENCNSVVEGVN
jgi:uncharacterized phage-associated protein